MTRAQIETAIAAYYDFKPLEIVNAGAEAEFTTYHVKGFRLKNNRFEKGVFVMTVANEGVQGSEIAGVDKHIPSVPVAPSTVVRDFVTTFLETTDAGNADILKWDNLFVSEDKAYATVTIWLRITTTTPNTVEERRYFIFRENSTTKYYQIV